MRVLVAEDNKKLAASLKKGLEQEGYSVDCSHDGKEAESIARSFSDSYDLIILDIMLPERDGITVCRRLRDSGIATPVLMLTARDGLDDRVQGLDSGADDYVVKPFSFEELTARIRALLRRPRSLVPAVLEQGGIVLDPAHRKVTVSGEEISLTLKEFRLLELFMVHPGQVLSREQIVEHLWDFDSELFSNAVDVHIKNLRRKLTGDRDAQTIETVRGVGYRFKV